MTKEYQKRSDDAPHGGFDTYFLTGEYRVPKGSEYYLNGSLPFKHQHEHRAPGRQQIMAKKAAKQTGKESRVRIDSKISPPDADHCFENDGVAPVCCNQLHEAVDNLGFTYCRLLFDLNITGGESENFKITRPQSCKDAEEWSLHEISFAIVRLDNYSYRTLPKVDVDEIAKRHLAAANG